MNQRIEGGYILQPRCIENSDISSSPPHVREVWNYLLRNANHSDKKYKGFEVKRGQLFRSYEDIIKDLSWKVGYRTESYTNAQMITAMRTLKKAGRITTTKAPRGVLITVCNYCFYQDPKNYDNSFEDSIDNINETNANTHTLPLSINKNERMQECKEYYSELLTYWTKRANLFSLSVSDKRILELIAEKYVNRTLWVKKATEATPEHITSPAYMKKILDGYEATGEEEPWNVSTAKNNGKARGIAGNSRHTPTLEDWEAERERIERARKGDPNTG